MKYENVHSQPSTKPNLGLTAPACPHKPTAAKLVLAALQHKHNGIALHEHRRLVLALPSYGWQGL
jgi:hypothetical protein